MNEPSIQIRNRHRPASISYCDATQNPVNTSLRSRSVRILQRMNARASTCTFPRRDRHLVWAVCRARYVVPTEYQGELPTDRTRDVPASIPGSALRSLATEPSFEPE